MFILVWRWPYLTEAWCCHCIFSYSSIWYSTFTVLTWWVSIIDFKDVWFSAWFWIRTEAVERLIDTRLSIYEKYCLMCSRLWWLVRWQTLRSCISIKTLYIKEPLLTAENVISKVIMSDLNSHWLSQTWRNQ